MSYFKSKLLLLLAVSLPLLMQTAVVVAESTATGDPAVQQKSKRFITIDFDNVDIQLFIKYISELTGKNFIVDKSVQGNVTIVSPTKISEEEAYRVFESVLEVHGYTTVTSGSVCKILPAVKARSQNVETLRMGFAEHPEDKIVTQLIPLKHTTPNEMKKVLMPLVSKTSVVIAHTQSGMLILTETLSNIQRLLSIIEAIDVEYAGEDVVVLPLQNASSTTVAKVINTIFQRAGNTPKGAKPKTVVRVVPYERVNSLIVLAATADVMRIKRLITLLDAEAERGEGNIHVFYLQNATSTELAKVLNALPVEKPGEANKGKAPAISKDVKIMADEETNSLIITASRSEYSVLEQVIKKLDIPRRMVYLETLIMEVNTSKDFEVGVQWLTGGKFADGTGTLATGFSGTEEGAYENLAGISAENPNLPAGFSLGVLKSGIKIGGITFPNIGAIVRAFKSDSDINIISNPQILTTDNKKAEISVGENIPYITSQNTTDSAQDYTQYEYKDVSTKLTITPHINQSNALRLEIATEVIKLKSNSVDLTPTTFKRTADTTVIINDNDTVVLGGIIGHDATASEYKVPILGDIPGLGWLFKTQSTTSDKTNMFIFVTPHIIKNPADIAKVTMKKEDDLGKVIPHVEAELHKKVNPEHSVKLTELGYQKLQSNNIQGAKEYFKEALEVNPNNPYALINLGVVYEREGKKEMALDTYQKVIMTNTGITSTGDTDDQRGGLPLLQVARENIQRLQGAKKQKQTPESIFDSMEDDHGSN
jgi:general secretion pathway protein D